MELYSVSGSGGVEDGWPNQLRPSDGAGCVSAVVCDGAPGLQQAANSRTCELAEDRGAPEVLRQRHGSAPVTPTRLCTRSPAGQDRVQAVTGEPATRTDYWGYRNGDGTAGVRRFPARARERALSYQ